MSDLKLNYVAVAQGGKAGRPLTSGSAVRSPLELSFSRCVHGKDTSPTYVNEFLEVVGSHVSVSPPQGGCGY